MHKRHFNSGNRNKYNINIISYKLFYINYAEKEIKIHKKPKK